MGETLRLAEHVAGLRWEDLPSSLVADLKTLLLDYLGVAAGGSSMPSARIAAQFQRQYGAAVPEATIIGAGARATAQAAAFANAVASHSIELDDVDHLALFHFSPPVYSSALAAAEAAGASGGTLLAALAAGCDVMARLSKAANPMLRDRGFHTTPTCGAFGAAAAAARVFGLTASETAGALGIAGAHAGGLMEMYGPSMQKRINPGPAAQAGIVAARLSRMGYTGADTILEGERGFLRAFAGQTDASELVRDLGREYPIHIEYKPYACARPIHNAVDCALELRGRIQAQAGGEAGAPPGRIAPLIESMTLRRHPSWAHYHQIPAPRTPHEAQVSVNHAVAVALVEGAAFLEQFDDRRIADEDVRRLSRLLAIEADPSLPRGVSCRLDVTLTGGESLEAQVDFPKGSLQNPMTPEEHARKFESLAGTRLDRARRDAVREMVADLESLASVGELMRLLA